MVDQATYDKAMKDLRTALDAVEDIAKQYQASQNALAENAALRYDLEVAEGQAAEARQGEAVAWETTAQTAKARDDARIRAERAEADLKAASFAHGEEVGRLNNVIDEALRDLDDRKAAAEREIEGYRARNQAQAQTILSLQEYRDAAKVEQEAHQDTRNALEKARAQVVAMQGAVDKARDILKANIALQRAVEDLRSELEKRPTTYVLDGMIAAAEAARAEANVVRAKADMLDRLLTTPDDLLKAQQEILSLQDNLADAKDRIRRLRRDVSTLTKKLAKSEG